MRWLEYSRISFVSIEDKNQLNFLCRRRAIKTNYGHSTSLFIYLLICRVSLKNEFQEMN